VRAAAGGFFTASAQSCGVFSAQTSGGFSGAQAAMMHFTSGRHDFWPASSGPATSAAVHSTGFSFGPAAKKWQDRCSFSQSAQSGCTWPDRPFGWKPPYSQPATPSTTQDPSAQVKLERKVRQLQKEVDSLQQQEQHAMVTITSQQCTRLERQVWQLESEIVSLRQQEQPTIVVSGRQYHKVSFAFLSANVPGYEAGAFCDGCRKAINGCAAIWHAAPQPGESGGSDCCLDCALPYLAPVKQPETTTIPAQPSFPCDGSDCHTAGFGMAHSSSGRDGGFGLAIGNASPSGGFG
jgi:hypothetical protein